MLLKKFSICLTEKIEAHSQPSNVRGPQQDTSFFRDFPSSFLPFFPRHYVPRHYVPYKMIHLYPDTVLDAMTYGFTYIALVCGATFLIYALIKSMAAENQKLKARNYTLAQMLQTAELQTGTPYYSSVAAEATTGESSKTFLRQIQSRIYNPPLTSTAYPTAEQQSYTRGAVSADGDDPDM